VPGGSGTITQAEAEPTNQSFYRSAEITGLTPEVVYYVLIRATNADGSASEEVGEGAEAVNQGGQPGCETEPLRPQPLLDTAVPVRNVTAASAHASGRVNPRRVETRWHIQYATSEAGPWTTAAGAEGTISKSEAEGTPAGGPYPEVSARLAGLSSATNYFVRVLAESEPEFGGHKELKQASSQLGSFRTPGAPPEPSAFAVHSFHGEALRLLGFVNSDDGTPTSQEQLVTIEGAPTGGTFTLTFNGQTTGGTATGELTAGSPTVSVPLALVKGTGHVRYPGSASGEPEVAAVTTTAGQFLPGRPISGPGIAPGTHIRTVETNAQGTTLTLTNLTTADVSGAELTSSGPLEITAGEALRGNGIPANATVTAVEFLFDFTATLTLSADATETASAVALTGNLPFDATSAAVQKALADHPAESVPASEHVSVTGPAGGPYTLFFGGELAGKHQPQIEANGSGLTPSGTVMVATIQPGGESGHTHYHFEYISDEAFKADGESFGASTEGTSEVEATGAVGADLPSLKSGETYHYRLYATSTVLGNPVVRSGEQTLVVPQAPQPSASKSASEEPCENAALRTGFSAKLPDCRAYEQLTPVSKRGTMDIGTYGAVVNRTQVGEDGEHLMLTAPGTNWGANPDSKTTSYFFSRTPAGWTTTSATPQPEAGALSYFPETLTANLEQITVSVLAEPTSYTSSSEVKLMIGPPGGPYSTVVSVPVHHRKDMKGTLDDPRLEWAGGSADGRKWILDSGADRHLPGLPATGTTEHEDLYEYFEGRLKQLNVDSEGHTIGACGAALAAGLESRFDATLAESIHYSSPHTISADDQRVFFYAGFGGSCPDPELQLGYASGMHLYERVGGSTTVDIGAYHFLAANAQGTELLLQKFNTGSYEDVLYNTETATAKPLFSAPVGAGQAHLDHLAVSPDFTAVYLNSEARLTPEAPPGGGLYRYDLTGERLKFIVSYRWTSTGGIATSPDGRYLYFAAVSVGGVIAGRQDQSPGSTAGQVYRYDSVENLVQCISCASPFNPEPKLLAAYLYGHETVLRGADGRPDSTVASSNGDFVFFETPAALVPSDIDGEIPPETVATTAQHLETVRSPSSDTYEWRRDGVDGCAHAQGCLALISGGTGGFKNNLLGTTPSGRDVFFMTHEALVSSDTDKAGDIYDARIGGGFPPPAPRPVECEGDACSTPFAPPVDATPSSSTFQGAGNLLQASVVPVAPKPVVKPPVRKPCKAKGTRRAKSRCKAKGKGGKRARRAASKRRAKR
jgi:hypothetical protein